MRMISRDSVADPTQPCAVSMCHMYRMLIDTCLLSCLLSIVFSAKSAVVGSQLSTTATAAKKESDLEAGGPGETSGAPS